MPHRLTRIYTRNGDAGATRLGDGCEVSKLHPRIAAMGDLDEVNSLVGTVLATMEPGDLKNQLEHIQHTLFDAGGELAMPGQTLVKAADSTQLEHWMDEMNRVLGPLQEFILPGGSPPAASCHLARAVCRRAERTLFALAGEDRVAPELLAYINRLSDYLFTAARELNRLAGHQEVYWKREKRNPP